MKKLSDWLKKRAVLIVIILAAVLLEVISAIQYRYTRGLLEEELEKSALQDLMTSALRIQEIVVKAEVGVSSQVWHTQRHLDDPDYMNMLVASMAQDGGDNIVGAGIGFKPYYYPSKGKLYEVYGRETEDSVEVEQIASEQHDYTQTDFYQIAMRGDTVKWTPPYLDAEGAKGVVTTYGMPVRDKRGEPVAVLLVDMATNWVGEVVNQHHRNPSSFSLVISEDGDFIAGPDDSLASPSLVKKIVDMVNDSTVAREIKAKGRVTGFPFYDEERGESGHVYYANKRYEPRWQMVIVCYDKEVYGKLEDMRRYIMWMALAGLAVLAVIIQLFVRSQRRLQATQMEQERIGSELRIAKDIQTQMLPRTNTVTRNDMDVFGSLVPAREVGGDLFDFFLRDEKLFFCIGDVSGKGVPSAMLMAVTHTLFRSISAHVNNPAHMMHVINETSCRGNESNMFVTFFIGVLDLPTGRLRYCNAGHDKPILVNSQPVHAQDDSPSSILHPLDTKPNLPVGLFEDVNYEEHELMIAPGSMLFLYTDGLTEARDGHRQFFGLKRVQEVLQGFVPDGKPQALLQTMTNAVNQFVEDAEQSDDLTMLAIRYSPETEKDVLNETLMLKNDLHQIDVLSGFVKDITKRLNIASKTAGNVQLAVEEAEVNVMNYAYPLDLEGDITVNAKSDGRWLRFIIIDEGVHFDPTEALPVDTKLSAEDRPIGGLGIHMLRKLMDSINYERIDGKNILTLRKEIENVNEQTNKRTT
jgi:sigma-B regulation protein RsbU (phosphoserine phosphatase)